MLGFVRAPHGEGLCDRRWTPAGSRRSAVVQPRQTMASVHRVISSLPTAKADLHCSGKKAGAPGGDAPRLQAGASLGIPPRRMLGAARVGNAQEACRGRPAGRASRACATWSERPRASSSSAGYPEGLPASARPGVRDCLNAAATLCFSCRQEAMFQCTRGYNCPLAEASPATVGEHRCLLVDTRRRSRCEPQVSCGTLLCRSGSREDLPLRNMLMLLENAVSLEFYHWQSAFSRSGFHRVYTTRTTCKGTLP